MDHRWTSIITPCLVLMLLVHHVRSTCDTYDLTGTICYAFYPGPLSWTDAHAQCLTSQDGANSDLVKISNDNINSILSLLVVKGVTTAWLGGVKTPYADWNWAWDKSTLGNGFASWAPGQPVSDTNKGCAYLDTAGSYWYNDNCGRTLAYICQANTCVVSGGPQTDVMDASGHCYSIIRVNQATAGLSWFSAESQCEAWGGTLASIGNAQVSTLLATIIQPLQADITSKQITGFWFGLSKDHWVWRVDGSVIPTNMWSSSEPAFGGCTETNTQFATDTNQLPLIAADCNSVTLPYICQSTLVVTVPPSPSTTTTVAMTTVAPTTTTTTATTFTTATTTPKPTTATTTRSSSTWSTTSAVWTTTSSSWWTWPMSSTSSTRMTTVARGPEAFSETAIILTAVAAAALLLFIVGAIACCCVNGCCVCCSCWGCCAGKKKRKQQQVIQNRPITVVTLDKDPPSARIIPSPARSIDVYNARPSGSAYLISTDQSANDYSTSSSQHDVVQRTDFFSPSCQLGVHKNHHQHQTTSGSNFHWSAKPVQYNNVLPQFSSLYTPAPTAQQQYVNSGPASSPYQLQYTVGGAVESPYAQYISSNNQAAVYQAGGDSNVFSVVRY